MTRTLFGGSAADLQVKAGGDGDLEADSTTTADAYTTGPDRTGGTHMTDLAEFQPGAMGTPGSARTTVNVQSDGSYFIWGPDEYKGPFWIQFASGPRKQIFPSDIVARLAAAEAAIAEVGTGKPEGGWDDEDLTEELQTLIAGAIQGDGTATSLLLADGSELALGTSEQVVRVNAAGDAFETHTPDAPALDDASDVSAADPSDGDVLLYSEADGEWQAVDASGVFATVDSDGDLDSSNYPRGYQPTFTVNSGDANPAGTITGDHIWVRTAVAATLGISSVGTGNNGSTPGSSQTVSNTGASFSSGDYSLVLASVSAEATYPTAFSATGPTNIGSMTAGPATVQGSTVGSLMFLQKATGSVSTSSTFTVTASGGTASRSDWALLLAKITGLAASSPVDLSATGGGANATSLSVATSGPTTTPNQIAVACFGYNPTTGGTFTPTGGWNLLGSVVQNTDSAPRAVAVVYKTLTSTGIVTATATLTNPAVYSAALITLKAA
jgi:hypothetical protein